MEDKICYKGTNKDLKCNGFQFEVGKEYEYDGDIKLCEKGFHACENPLDVLTYYLAGNSRFFEVKQTGEQETDTYGDSKIVSSKIKVNAEINFADLIKAGVDFLLKHTKTKIAQGDRGHAAAQGYSGHAAAQGYKGHAAAQGERGHAAAQGESGSAAAQGKESIAVSCGICGKAQSKQSWIVIVDWRCVKDEWIIKNIYHAKVGQKIKGRQIKPDTTYWFENGKLKQETPTGVIL